MKRDCNNCENRGLGFVCVECRRFDEDNDDDLWKEKPKFRSGDFEYDVPDDKK